MTWPVAALGEVAEINPRPSRRPSGTDEIAFLPMAELDGRTGTTRAGTVRPFGEVSKGYTVFQDADILVAKITPCFENNKIGQARLARQIGVGSTEFHVVRPNDAALDARYVLHYLRQDSIRQQGERRMTGSAGQRRVPANFLESLAVPMPPLEEQRRIAAILDRADDLCTMRCRFRDGLRTLVQSIFFDMFGDPDTAIGTQRTIPLRDVVQDLQGGRNLVAGDADAVTQNRVLKISSVTSGEFRAYESKPLPDEYDPPLAHFVRSGDLLISRANTAELVGATAYVAGTPSNLVLPDKIWRFVWQPATKVEPLYVWALFGTAAMRRAMASRATGTGGSMKNISKAKMMSLPVPWPRYADQLDFVERLRSVYRLADSASGQDEERLRATLQSAAFSGLL